MAKQRKNKGKTGRNPLPDIEKKVCVQVYIKQQYINDAGGMKVAREKAINAILGL